MEFSSEDLRLLAQIERDMDSGLTPWVHVEGTTGRARMRPAIMEALGLVTGQMISLTMFREITKLNLEHVRQQIAFEQGQKLIREELKY